jgi:hypothetical protein
MDNPEIDVEGNKWWYEADDKLHRDDGPAVEYADGDEEWWQHGELHRDDGPAVVNSSYYTAWVQHDELHRDDGPAVIYTNGDQEWYLNGKKLSFDEWLDEAPDMSNEDKVMFKLEHA